MACDLCESYTVVLSLQEKCCGVNGYKDWQRTPFTKGNHTFVPDSCCKEVKTGCGVIPGGTDTSKINTEVTILTISTYQYLGLYLEVLLALFSMQIPKVGSYLYPISIRIQTSKCN